MPIQTITTPVYTKPLGGTTVQKTLKDDVTTYFATIAVGANGTGSLVTENGVSKGALAVVGPQDLGGFARYVVLFPSQYTWLGAPVATVQNPEVDNNPEGEAYVTMCGTFASQDLTAISPNGINIIGIGDQPVGVLSITTYKLSGSTEPNATVPPSGSLIHVTINGTKSPVF